MPTQKDFKRRVRDRMKKTGESYTAARRQLLAKHPTPPATDYAKLAGMSNAKVREKTGRTWADWVVLLDAAQAFGLPHRAIAQHVSSLGTTDWWSQMVTVGYERIRGLRERGQRRDGAYEANKSRTYPVAVDVLFDAFASSRTRKRWLPVNIIVRSSRPPRSMRIVWADGTPVQLAFISRSSAKSTVAVQHEKLVNRSAAQAMKQAWASHLDRLGSMLAP